MYLWDTAASVPGFSDATHDQVVINFNPQTEWGLHALVRTKSRRIWTTQRPNMVVNDA